MPELPEVHALVADLGSRILDRTIARVELVSFSALKTFDPPLTAVSGRSVTAITRRGKFLAFALDVPADADRSENSGGDRLQLVMHLARAGWIRWREKEPAPSRSARRGPLAARLVLDDGSGFDVTEAGTKKSLALYLVRDPAEVPGIARLGPDPLGSDFTENVFRGILAAQGRSQIKGVLRNQSIIAGIGNAYSDEILHAAKMSPFARADMGADDSSRLYGEVRKTLQQAVQRAEGSAMSDLKKEKKTNLQVHGRAGEICPVCGDTVQQVRFADSSLEYCPTCQTGGKILANRVLSRLLK